MVSKEYYIKVDGQSVPVTEEVYREYIRPMWKEQRQMRRKTGTKLSLDMMIEVGIEIADNSATITEMLEEKELLDMLNKALDKLDDDERFLITELFYRNKTECELARNLHVSQQAINKRKLNLLSKLKQMLTNG